MSDTTTDPTAPDPTGWVDRHGDVWREGTDGLLNTPETRPFPREHVERKWGPLSPVSESPGPRKVAALGVDARVVRRHVGPWEPVGGEQP